MFRSPLRKVEFPDKLGVGLLAVLVPLAVLLWLSVAVPVSDALKSPEADLELLPLLPSSPLPVSTGGSVVAGGAPPAVGVASSARRITWKLWAVASCNAKMRQSKAQIRKGLRNMASKGGSRGCLSKRALNRLPEVSRLSTWTSKP